MPHHPANPSDGASPTPETAPTAGLASTSVLGAIGAAADPDLESYPKQIGHYKIIRKLGRGGMGVVLLGVRDDDQFHKRVAIKLIRRGIDSSGDGKEVLKRFDLERQVLGALNHPNIARLLDAGQLPDPDGRPYFVMEFVEGEPIDEYCDRMQLTTEQRLGMFQKVCAAVHHAHQNLVVHRDIKPANVLVDINNEPKLMDFGIAKLLNPAMAGLTLATSWDRGPMTPEYASPEQIQGKPVSTASDVYALGVLMYELLTGRRPYRLKHKARGEMERAILEDEPEKPSTAVMQEETVETDGQTRTVTAEAYAKPREGAVTRLRRKLAGDVDNIVLMAMRKSPQRRYASAEAFAADISRHLKGEAVQAAPDSFVYRADKFIRRNRLGVAAAIAVVGALVAGGTVASIGWKKALDAAAAERAAKDRASQLANENLALAGTYYRSLADAIKKLEGSTDTRYSLAQAAISQLEQLAATRKDDPVLLRQLAQAYTLASDVLGGVRGGNKANVAKAREPLEKSQAILLDLHKRSPDDPEITRLLAANLIRIGDLRRSLRNIGDPLESYQEAIDLVAKPGGAAAKDPQSDRVLAQALLEHGNLLALSGDDAKLAKAGEEFERSLRIREAALANAPEDPDRKRDLSVGLNRMAKWYGDAKDDEKTMLKLLRQALDLRESIVTKEPTARAKLDVLLACEEIARVHIMNQTAAEDAARPEDDPRVKAATPLMSRAYELAKDLLRTDSDSARAEETMAETELLMGDLAWIAADDPGALKHHAEALRIAREIFRRDESSLRGKERYARALASHGYSLDRAGEPEKALREERESKALWSDLVAASPKNTAFAQGLQKAEAAIVEFQKR